MLSYARPVLAPDWCGEAPGTRASAAAAVATALRRAAAGWCGEFPRAHPRPPSAGALVLPCHAVSAVTHRQARGALGAPLKT
jgi:hypothetical protein